jgi:DnaK suppressor protein
MGIKKLKDTRQRLACEYENLIQSIGRARLAADEITIEKTEDEGDLAAISHERSLLHNLYESDLARLRFIEEAMKGLDRGEYGECVRCGDNINEKRLEVVPWATMCLRCQGETEMEASSRLVPAGRDAEQTEW